MCMLFTYNICIYETRFKVISDFLQALLNVVKLIQPIDHKLNEEIIYHTYYVVMHTDILTNNNNDIYICCLQILSNIVQSTQPIDIELKRIAINYIYDVCSSASVEGNRTIINESLDELSNIAKSVQPIDIELGKTAIDYMYYVCFHNMTKVNNELAYGYILRLLEIARSVQSKNVELLKETISHIYAFSFYAITKKVTGIAAYGLQILLEITQSEQPIDVELMKEIVDCIYNISLLNLTDKNNEATIQGLSMLSYIAGFKPMPIKDDNAKQQVTIAEEIQFMADEKIRFMITCALANGKTNVIKGYLKSLGTKDISFRLKKYSDKEIETIKFIKLKTQEYNHCEEAQEIITKADEIFAHHYEIPHMYQNREYHQRLTTVTDIIGIGTIRMQRSFQ